MIASGDFIALAMTSRKSHCESAVADAAVSVQITHARTKFLRRRESDVAIPIKDCFTSFAMTHLLSTLYKSSTIDI